MKKMIFGFAVVLAIVSLPAPESAAEDSAAAMRKQEVGTVTLELKFRKKNRNSLQQAISVLDLGPNGFATGFYVGDGLVMTAYHVVSGDLSISKKAQLGFGAKDQLVVKASVNGCQATLLKVDVDADLALLGVCQSKKQSGALTFQASLSKDEKVHLIARPNGDKMVRRGIFDGPYMFRGQQFWSAKIVGRDGFSGSPIYNDRAEVVGVFSRYDWPKKLAVISPGERAQKLLEDYLSESKPGK
jgi:S1-C subfamily serine protease